MTWFRRKPQPPPTDWVPTDNERWVVLKRADNVVREALMHEWIDLNTGTREWRPVRDCVGGPEHFRWVRRTRIRTLMSGEVVRDSNNQPL